MTDYQIFPQVPDPQVGNAHFQVKSIHWRTTGWSFTLVLYHPSTIPFFSHQDNLPLFVVQWQGQHLPPGLQSAVKQLFGERSSPVIKLVTRKTEGSQLANCVKEWLMTIFELFSCKWGYWEGHIEINFLHLLTPSLGINYSSRKQGDKSLWKLQKIWAEWPQAQATYYDGSSQVAWWGKKTRRRVAIQTAKLERLLDHCSWGNILGDMLKSRFLWANREIWEPSLAAGA